MSYVVFRRASITLRTNSRNEPGFFKLVDGKTEQVEFQSLTMRLKYEAWKVLVLQIGVFRLRVNKTVYIKVNMVV